MLHLSLPLNVPGPAMFGRENFEHTVKQIGPGAYDDVFTCNPQSGTQWDGFRHVSRTCLAFGRAELAAEVLTS